MVAQNLKKQSTDNKLLTPAEMAEIVSSNTFPNLYKLLNIAYTIPISSATCKNILCYEGKKLATFKKCYKIVFQI